MCTVTFAIFRDLRKMDFLKKVLKNIIEILLRIFSVLIVEILYGTNTKLKIFLLTFCMYFKTLSKS